MVIHLFAYDCNKSATMLSIFPTSALLLATLFVATNVSGASEEREEGLQLPDDHTKTFNLIDEYLSQKPSGHLEEPLKAVQEMRLSKPHGSDCKVASIEKLVALVSRLNDMREANQSGEPTEEVLDYSLGWLMGRLKFCNNELALRCLTNNTPKFRYLIHNWTESKKEKDASTNRKGFWNFLVTDYPGITRYTTYVDKITLRYRFRQTIEVPCEWVQPVSELDSYLRAIEPVSRLLSKVDRDELSEIKVTGDFCQEVEKLGFEGIQYAVIYGY